MLHGTLTLRENQNSTEPCLGPLGRTPQVLDYLKQSGGQLAPEAKLGGQEGQGRGSGGETEKRKWNSSSLLAFSKQDLVWSKWPYLGWI